jgi:phosphoribosylanthranilate isomerase
MLLVDGPAAGSGASFDHAELADLLPTLRKPLFVAGGLTPDNVASLLAIAKPYGVDVSSGVEHTRGVKDHGLIRAFCDAVKSS